MAAEHVPRLCSTLRCAGAVCTEHERAAACMWAAPGAPLARLLFSWFCPERTRARGVCSDPKRGPRAQAGLSALEHFELSAAPGGRVTAAGLPALLRAAPALRAAALCGLVCGGAALPPPPLGPVPVPSLGPAAACTFAGVTATVTLVGAHGASLAKDPGVAAGAWPPAAVPAAAGLPPSPDGRAGAAHAARPQARGAAQRTHAPAVPAAERSQAASSTSPVCLAPGGLEVRSAAWATPRAAPGPGLSGLTSLELSAEDLGDLAGLAALPRLRALSLRALAPCRGGAGRRGARGGAVLRADCVAALRRLERLALHSVRCPDGVRAPPSRRSRRFAPCCVARSLPRSC